MTSRYGGDGYRAGALVLLATLQGCDALPTLDEAGDPNTEPSARPIYRYETADGRFAFTDDPSRIPAGARSNASPLDLSHVSLNEELGRDLDRAVAEEHARLSATPTCERAEAATEGGLPARLLEEHGALLAISALVVLLVVTAPFIARRVPEGAWLRFLLLVVPIVVLMAIFVEATRHAQQRLDVLRTTSDLCDADAFRERTIADRVSTVQDLERVLARETGDRAEQGITGGPAAAPD